MKFFRFRKNKKSVIMITAIFSSLLLVPTITQARGGWAESLVGGIARMILSALTWILTKVMAVLIYVASYNDFIKSATVSEGWVITRDVANMFFIIILLIIAFATILQIEQYNYKKWLPKLVLMAILINFSKTICGLLIDLGQVIMLTFVNAFLGITAGGFFDMLGMADWKNLSGKDSDISGWTIAAMYVLAVIYALISLIVVIAITFTLIIRMVMLWIYIVLSPLAYLLSAFPGGQKYASQWWGDFTKHLIVGPVLAFFLWLSFASLINLQEISSVSEGFDEYESSVSQGGEIGKPSQLGGYTSEKKGIDTSETMLGFLISIGMLLGGLMISQEIGGAAGKASAVAFGSIKSRADKMTRAADKMTRATYRAPIKATKLAAAGAAGLAVGGLARSERVKDALGAAGSSRIPVLRGLAAKAHSKLASKEKAQDEKAEQFVGSMEDTRILERWSRDKEFMIPWERARQVASRRKLGYHVEGFGSGRTYVSELDQLDNQDFGKLSMEAVSELGNRGISAEDNQEFVEHLRSNRYLLRAYNYGVIARVMREGGNLETAGLVRLIDRQGNLTDDLGFGTNALNYGRDILGSAPVTPGGGGMPANARAVYSNPNYYRFTRGQVGSRKRAYEYSKASEQAQILQENGTTAVPLEDRDQIRGQGNLSLGSFARAQGNVLAVDFDKLNLSDMDKDGAEDFRNIKGVHTFDPEAIKEIFSKLSSIINQELSSLESKTNLDAYEKRRVNDLKAAQERIDSPQDITSVSLLNSSAANYSHGDLKRAHIHEETHRLGVRSETVAHKVTEAIVQTRNYGALESPEKLNEFISKHGITDKSTPVNQIIKQEQDAQIISLDIPEIRIDLDDVRIDSASIEALNKINTEMNKGLPQALNKAVANINFPISSPSGISSSLSPLASKSLDLGLLKGEIAKGNKILAMMFSDRNKPEEAPNTPLVVNYLSELNKLTPKSKK